MNRRLTAVAAILCILGLAFILFGAVALNNALSNQNPTVSFTPSTQFIIPIYNSTINFAQNGHYTAAYFENNSYTSGYRWEFVGLQLGNSVSSPNQNWGFTISAQNCNVTVTAYSQTGENVGMGSFNYTVVGTGNQTLNFGGNLQNVTVSIDEVLRSLNDGWTLNDYADQITATNAKSNVTIDYSVLIPMPA